jgi:hypothetical protein
VALFGHRETLPRALEDTYNMQLRCMQFHLYINHLMKQVQCLNI